MINDSDHTILIHLSGHTRLNIFIQLVFTVNMFVFFSATYNNPLYVLQINHSLATVAVKESPKSEFDINRV